MQLLTTMKSLTTETLSSLHKTTFKNNYFCFKVILDRNMEMLLRKKQRFYKKNLIQNTKYKNKALERTFVVINKP